MLVRICQSDKVAFSFLESTYLALAQAAASVVCAYGFWRVQKYFKFPTKKMVCWVVVAQFDANLFAVRYNNCLDNGGPALGDGWNLDQKIRVRDVTVDFFFFGQPNLEYLCRAKVFIMFGSFGEFIMLFCRIHFSQLPYVGYTILEMGFSKYHLLHLGSRCWLKCRRQDLIIWYVP